MLETVKTCSIEGCTSPENRKGWCNAHYLRWYRNGDPLKKKGADRGEPVAYLNNTIIPYKGNECISWPFAKDRFGRGRINFKGKMRFVHRIICEEFNGPQPNNMPHAAHKCGNGHKACCTPSHMKWATVSENQMDRVTHGTSNRGQRQWKNKLTEDQVKEIKYGENQNSQHNLAKQYGVNQSVISTIRSGKSWSWI